MNNKNQNVSSRYAIVAEHMERLRSCELEQVRNHFERDMRVLEIGGGNGLQAAKIAKWGCQVTSIDLPNRENRSIYFDVIDYDGENFPFDNNIFDIVFSSNVLEHVVNIDKVLFESKRVLKPTGLAIHIMPTPSWRFWTIVSHYPYLMGSMLRRIMTLNVKGNKLYPAGTSLAFPPPHGTYTSAFHELYYYSTKIWLKIFTRNGFKLSKFWNNGVFCTGYAIFATVKIPTRKIMSKIFGSSGVVYIFTPIK